MKYEGYIKVGWNFIIAPVCLISLVIGLFVLLLGQMLIGSGQTHFVMSEDDHSIEED